MVFGTPDKVIDHMLEQKTDGDNTEGTISCISISRVLFEMIAS